LAKLNASARTLPMPLAAARPSRHADPVIVEMEPRGRLRALGGPQSPPVRGGRQAFRGGQRSALRFQDAQQISVQGEVVGPMTREALGAH
jgi:hypothetical protein